VQIEEFEKEIPHILDFLGHPELVEKGRLFCKSLPRDINTSGDKSQDDITWKKLIDTDAEFAAQLQALAEIYKYEV
jgi:hypothetical protein